MKVDIKKLETNPQKYAKSLTEEEAAAAVLELDAKYFQARPLVSDAIYESFRSVINSRFKKIEKKIGAKLSDDDVKLPIPMSSLNQFKEGTPQLAKALIRNTKQEVILSDKLDGQSVEIVYRDHQPVAAYTRGDATSGKDISHHIPFMHIPLEIPVKNMTIRFEAIIPLKAFNKYLHEDSKSGFKYRAARNAVAGLTRSFTPVPKAFQHIRLVAFQIVGGKYSDKKQSIQFKKLKAMGFETVRHFGPFSDLGLDELKQHYEDRMAASKYELDGIVVTYNIEPDVPSEDNPQHAWKFKMNADADAVLVTVLRVVWQISKYGSLTPVVEFAPTPMSGGVVVQRAAGHNAFYILNGYLKGEGSGKPRPIGEGAVLKIVRSGKVIPYIQEIIKPAKKPMLPDVEYVEDGVDFRLVGKSTETTARLLSGFMSSMKFIDQGPTTARKLVDAGIENVKDLYHISPKKATALLKAAKGRSLATSIKLSREKTDLATWLAAVAPFYMEGASSTFAKVCDAVPNILELKSSLQLLHEVKTIKGIKTKARDITLTITHAIKLADACDVNLVQTKFVATSTALAHVIAAFSGVRDAALKQEILEGGGACSDSMTAACNVLIVKDPGAGSSKIDKAQAKGIPILTPAQFRAQYLG